MSGLEQVDMRNGYLRCVAACAPILAPSISTFPWQSAAQADRGRPLATNLPQVHLSSRDESILT